MANQRIKRGDIISHLPDSVLHHILSFMEYRQIAQTSVLSKRWESVWRTYPVLEFAGPFWEDPVGNMVRRNEQLRYLVKTVCDRHKDMINLWKFTLSARFVCDKKFTSLVDQCICHAIGCNVKELELDMCFLSLGNEYWDLPQIVLLAKSVEILILSGCRIESTRSDLNLSSLRKLTLYGVKISDRMIRNLVNSCSLVEFLSLHYFEGCETIELFGLPRLYEFQLGDNNGLKRLDVRLQNLCLVEIDDLTDAEINLISCKNLTSLKLSLVSISDEWIHDLITELQFLKFLSLDHCEVVNAVKISSLCLEELELHNCQEWAELKIDTPNLRHLELSGTIASLSLNATSLSEIVLTYVGRDIFTQNCIEFLENLGHLEALNLRIFTDKDMMVPTELRQTLSSPLSNLELLDYRTEKCTSIAKAVDDLLWIAPHTKVISIRNNFPASNEPVFRFKFTYKEQMIQCGKKEANICCKANPVSCWFDCMWRVDVEFQQGSNVMKCALGGACIWEKIEALTNAWMFSICAPLSHI